MGGREGGKGKGEGEGCALARESLQIKEKGRCWMLDVSESWAVGGEMARGGAFRDVILMLGFYG